MLDKDQLYTVQEIANHFKVVTKTIIRKLTSGELKGTKFGHQWRILGSDALEYWERGSQDGTN